LITPEKAAQLVQANHVVDYGMFATKPIDLILPYQNGP
jgi:hypothetical protein